MIWLSFIVLLLLGSQSTIAYIKTKTAFSPLLMVPALWFILISLYYLLPHDLFPLKQQFLISITLWTTSFFVGALLVDSGPSDLIRLGYNNASKKVRYILFFLTCLTSPIACYLLYREASEGPTGSFFVNLRIINIGEGDEGFSLGIFAYAFNLALISLLIELVEATEEKILNFKTALLILINLMLAFFTVGRLFFLNLIISIVVILVFKNRIKKKHFIIFGVVILGLFFMITMLRNSDDSIAVNELVFDTLKVYTMSPMPAFDTLQQDHSGWFGPNVFRFYYALINSFGFDVPVRKTIYEYAEVPYLTNVYSVMYIFFVDFGYKGVAFGGFLFGLFYQFLYKLSLAGNKPMLIFFAILVPTLLTQFTGEFLLTNFSNTLQFLIIIFIPYVFYKRA